MRLIAKWVVPSSASVTALTVSDTPSSVTEPLVAMNRPRSRATWTSIRVEPPSGADVDYIAGAIDMAGDEVAAELVAHPQRAFEVEAGAFGP